MSRAVPPARTTKLAQFAPPKRPAYLALRTVSPDEGKTIKPPRANLALRRGWK